VQCLLDPLVGQCPRRRVHPEAACDLYHAQVGWALAGEIRDHHHVARTRRLDAKEVLLLFERGACIGTGIFRLFLAWCPCVYVEANEGLGRRAEVVHVPRHAPPANELEAGSVRDTERRGGERCWRDRAAVRLGDGAGRHHVQSKDRVASNGVAVPQTNNGLRQYVTIIGQAPDPT